MRNLLLLAMAVLGLLPGGAMAQEKAKALPQILSLIHI